MSEYASTNTGDRRRDRPIAPIDPEILADDDGAPEVHFTHAGRDQDGVASLQGTEAETGDQSGIGDDFDTDNGKRANGVELDDRDEQEPGFD